MTGGYDGKVFSLGTPFCKWPIDVVRVINEHRSLRPAPPSTFFLLTLSKVVVKVRLTRLTSF